MGKRNRRGGGGGMKQMGFLDSDRDDFRPSNGKGGPGSSGGGNGSLGSKGKPGLCGKGGERPTFSRHVPKFLQKFECDST